MTYMTTPTDLCDAGPSPDDVVVCVIPGEPAWMFAGLTFYGRGLDMLATFVRAKGNDASSDTSAGPWSDPLVEFTAAGMALVVDDSEENADLLAAVTGPFTLGQTLAMLREARDVFLRKGVHSRLSSEEARRREHLEHLLALYALDDPASRTAALAVLAGGYVGTWDTLAECVATATTTASTELVTDLPTCDRPATPQRLTFTDEEHRYTFGPCALQPDGTVEVTLYSSDRAATSLGGTLDGGGITITKHLTSLYAEAVAELAQPYLRDVERLVSHVACDVAGADELGLPATRTRLLHAAYTYPDQVRRTVATALLASGYAGNLTDFTAAIDAATTPTHP